MSERTLVGTNCSNGSGMSLEAEVTTLATIFMWSETLNNFLAGKLSSGADDETKRLPCLCLLMLTLTCQVASDMLLHNLLSHARGSFPIQQPRPGTYGPS